jgi:tRNA 2-thiouridine synthesizing protein A
MDMTVLNTLGMRSPQAILKLAVKAVEMRAGETLEVWGDSPTFERDVRTWCNRLGKDFLSAGPRGMTGRRVQILF